MTRKTGFAVIVGLALAILGSPNLSAARGPAAHAPVDVGGFQVITSTIGDFDCFGYGAPLTVPANPRSPCGTLPGLPIADVADPPYTDVEVDCTLGNTFTLTHTFEVPVGATILGGVAVLNVGGIEQSTFNTMITADGAPAVNVPDTGALGTGLVAIPLVKSAASKLDDGQVDIMIRHGGGVLTPKCDPMFVDFSMVSVLIHLPQP